jgi:4a-hydroxytetrahydrobiopterin dehydratase
MSDAIKTTDFLAQAEDWRIVSDGACAFYRTSSLAESAKLVSALAETPALAGQSYGIDVRRDGVTVRTVTVREDIYGLTQADLDAAQQVSAVARGMGLVPDQSKIQNLLIIPGAPDIKAIMPFWQAVLGYMPRPDSPDEDLVDPHDMTNPFWFETMDEPRGDGLGAIHLAMWMPIEEAQKRVDAALAAGGHMVRDDFAPAWWTLADAYGNEIDVATIAYRDGPPPRESAEG